MFVISRRIRVVVFMGLKYSASIGNESVRNLEKAKKKIPRKPTAYDFILPLFRYAEPPPPKGDKI
jgi:hypothetical protein